MNNLSHDLGGAHDGEYLRVFDITKTEPLSGFEVEFVDSATWVDLIPTRILDVTKFCLRAAKDQQVLVKYLQFVGIPETDQNQGTSNILVRDVQSGDTLSDIFIKRKEDGYNDLDQSPDFTEWTEGLGCSSKELQNIIMTFDPLDATMRAVAKQVSNSETGRRDSCDDVADGWERLVQNALEKTQSGPELPFKLGAHTLLCGNVDCAVSTNDFMIFLDQYKPPVTSN